MSLFSTNFFISSRRTNYSLVIFPAIAIFVSFFYSFQRFSNFIFPRTMSKCCRKNNNKVRKRIKKFQIFNESKGFEKHFHEATGVRASLHRNGATHFMEILHFYFSLFCTFPRRMLGKHCVLTQNDCIICVYSEFFFSLHAIIRMKSSVTKAIIIKTNSLVLSTSRAKLVILHIKRAKQKKTN